MSLAFYQTLRPFEDFASVVDPEVYSPLPDDWWLVLSDVTASTRAIEAGRYKAVNFAGAAAIAATVAVAGSLDLPYAFGGDGSAVAVPPDLVEPVRTALAATARWAESDLSLELRVGLVPVAAIRATGRDVKVAAFAMSENVRIASFTGGGVKWAEQAMKAGQFRVAPTDSPAKPPLGALSCRWQPVEARRGQIVSLLIEPREGAVDGRWRDAVLALLALIGEDDPRSGHPVPEKGPGFTWPPEGLDLEARANRGGGSLAASRLKVGAATLLARLVDRAGRPVGGFDPALYKSDTALNTDFRKFDDGLKLTVDCTAAQSNAIETLLARAAADGVLGYGLHRQDSAVLTCIVPDPMQRQHVHFLDGAAGGYAFAARRLKEGIAATAAGPV